MSAHDPQTTADSAIYIDIGHGIADTGEFVRKYGGYYEVATERVPVYPIFLAIFFKLFGEGLTLPLVIQCLFDSLTCVLIAYIGKELYSRLFIPVGILAALNLNMAIHSTLILTDTLFLLFFVGSILFIVKYSVGYAYKWAVLASICLSLAVLTRPLMYYFLPIFLVVLGVIPLIRRGSVKYVVLNFCIGLVILSLFVGSLLLFNYRQYGYFQLVSVNGANAMEWYVPLTIQYSTGVDTDVVIKREQEKFRQMLVEAPDQILSENPFYVSKLKVQIAMDEFSMLSFFQIAYAWTGGALLNVFAPSVSSSPAMVQMKRPRFFETEGANFVHKIFNFLLHPENRLYLLMIVPSIFLTSLLRIISIFGLFVCVKKYEVSKIVYFILIGISLYFLVITGPLVSAARYRLPIEPIMIIFLAIGLITIYDYWSFLQPKLNCIRK